MAASMDSDQPLADEVKIELDEDLVQSPEHMQAQLTSIDFGGLLNPPLLLHQDLKDGCGGRLWPAGMVLANYMLRHRELSQLDHIVELGSGGGLVGLTVAQSMLSERDHPIMITDQEALLPLMNKNILHNGLTGHVKPLVLNWGDPLPQALEGQSINLVLAADCVYFEPAFPLLLQTLCDLSNEQTVVLFCYKRRRRADLHFMKMVRKIFSVDEVLDDPDRTTYTRENIFLYKMHKK